MLEKFIKRVPEKNVPSTADKPGAKSDAPKARAVDPVGEEEWLSRIRNAASDEVLLDIARQSQLLAVKEAAIAAMTTEAGLKAAEREFRSHDRRVYREAKLRYEGKVTERMAQDEAAALIATGRALLAADPIPANRFVDMDRAWKRLDTARLSPEQVREYEEISATLSATLRARGDLQQGFKRWQAEAETALKELVEGSLAVAHSGLDRDRLATVYDRVEKLRGQGAVLTPAVASAAPASETAEVTPADAKAEAQQREVDHMQSQLESALQLARALDARLNFLDELVHATGDDGHESVGTATGTAAGTAAGAANARWQALPIVSEPRVAKTLNDRFDAVRRAGEATAKARASAVKAEDAEAEKRAKGALREALEAMLAKAELALSAGQIVEATTLASAIEAKAKALSLQGKLASRIGTLRDEVARLKGWQHWSGGRVREELVDQALALAEAIKHPKLNLKAHDGAIDQLRERWKELDKLGGATSRELWLKFDGALKTAYLPIDASIAKQKAVRQENLGARNALIAKLKADAASLVAGPVVDFRQATRLLDAFNTEWRKLGPVEHTVPHKAQAALTESMKGALALLEAPLAEARRVEVMKREKLVQRAKEIAADTKARDTINRVRTLQAEWQEHAKSLPLARHDENRLWNEFKAATDAVFKARDAETAARDAAAKSELAGRDELIGRLTVLDESTSPQEIRKVLNEVESAWRKAGEIPRHLAAKIESRFRQARDRARDLVSGSAKRSWTKVLDVLERKLALSTAAESGANVSEEWDTLPSVLPSWERALAARRAGGGADTSGSRDQAQDAMLKLEDALDIASPAAYQAKRRELKLLAMKRAIEARQTVTVSNAEIEAWVEAAIRVRHDDAADRARLASVIAALAKRPLQ